MKTIASISIIFLVTNLSLFSQENFEKYFSSEEKEFYEDGDTLYYNGYPLSYVNSLSFDYLQITDDTVSNNPLTGLLLDNSDWLVENNCFELDPVFDEVKKSNEEEKITFDTLNCRYIKLLKQGIDYSGESEPPFRLKVSHPESGFIY